jgi:hypothetical protein
MSESQGMLQGRPQRLCMRGQAKKSYYSLTLVFNGVCSFFFRRVCQYDLNEVRGFASDIPRGQSLLQSSLSPILHLNAVGHLPWGPLQIL